MEALFEKRKQEFEGLTKIPLLKKIASVSDDLFAKDSAFESDRQVFGKDKETEVVGAVLNHNFKNVKEFTPEFHQMLHVASNRQNITRSLIKIALKTLNHGFNKFDEALIYHAADISSAYDKLYIAWSKAVQGNEVSEKLTANESIDPKFHNPYTIIQLDEKGEYYDVPYATFFKNEIQPICEIFSTAIKELSQINDLSAEQKRYVDYLEQYRVSLSETDKSKLDAQGELLDEIWMDIKYYIQFVHDIETGYGDPLRVKIIPDFSIRFLDSEYSAANHTIETDIKNVMVDYFQKRNKDLANKGVFALANSFAGVYFLPFQSGMNLHFRFSGQSIPNRPEVKNKKGVKIYFDPVSTEQRGEQVKDFVSKAFNEEDAKLLNGRSNAVEDIVYHVAAHEFGHAIYNLAHLEDALTPSTRSLFEEPRAELTSLFTMKLLFDAKLIDESKLKSSLSNFAMGELRRFAAFTNSSTRPYTISATNTYKTYEQCGYITVKEDGKLKIDESKALDVLNVFTSQFEKILDAEDKIDGGAIENMKKNFELVEKIHNHLIQLFKISN